MNNKFGNDVGGSGRGTFKLLEGVIKPCQRIPYATYEPETF
jgi:hypothetical protein